MSTTQKDKDLEKKKKDAKVEKSKVEDTKEADTEQANKPEEKVEAEKKEDAVGFTSEDRQSVSEQIYARKTQWQDLKAKIREEDGGSCGS